MHPMKAIAASGEYFLGVFLFFFAMYRRNPTFFRGQTASNESRYGTLHSHTKNIFVFNTNVNFCFAEEQFL